MISKLSLQVDKNLNRPRVPPIWENKTFFGRIHHFLVHRYGDEEYLLAALNLRKVGLEENLEYANVMLDGEH
jgi:hypothetical protein